MEHPPAGLQASALGVHLQKARAHFRGQTKKPAQQQGVHAAAVTQSTETSTALKAGHNGECIGVSPVLCHFGEYAEAVMVASCPCAAGDESTVGDGGSVGHFGEQLC